VQIRAAAREAGERTKIAVQSRDKDVDPVGACVGMKGMRVQSIIRELRGEKIDIIPYSEDTIAFAQKSLSPAKVTRVQIIDPEARHLEVIVEDTQLSLAIGKKGQNVRLASKLLGWNVDIKSEEEKRQELEAQMSALTAPGTPLSELQGMGPKTVEKIEAAGIASIEKLADMTPEQLMEIPGIGEKMVDKIYQAVNRFYEGGEAATPAEGATETEETETAEEENAEAGSETAQHESEATETKTEPETETDSAAEATNEAVSDEESTDESTGENHSAGAEPTEPKAPEGQQEEKSS
jgi:transcription termination/antitermination protein NusA